MMNLHTAPVSDNPLPESLKAPQFALVDIHAGIMHYKDKSGTSFQSPIILSVPDGPYLGSLEASSRSSYAQAMADIQLGAIAETLIATGFSSVSPKLNYLPWF